MSWVCDRCHSLESEAKFYCSKCYEKGVFVATEKTTSAEEIGILQIQYCGRRSEFDMVRLSYPVYRVYSDGRKERLPYKKAVMIQVKADGLWDVSDGEETPARKVKRDT